MSAAGELNKIQPNQNISLIRFAIIIIASCSVASFDDEAASMYYAHGRQWG